MGIIHDVVFHPQWWNKNADVCFNKDFFYNADYRIDADIKMRRVLYEKFGDLGLGEKDPNPRPVLGSDLLASGFLYSEILGCEVRYSDENPPEVICANLTDDQVKNLKAPDLDKSELWNRIQNQIDYFKDKFGYVESCINLMGIQNIAMDLRGQNIFIDYYTNPELAHHLLDVCTKTSVDIGKRLKAVSKNLSAGVTSIVKKILPDVYLTSNCSVEMVSLEVYEDFLLKYDNILAENFKPFGIHHCGKTTEHVVDGYARVKDLAFVEVGAFSDIGYVKKQLPDILLNARYSPVKLKDVSKEEMKSDIVKIVKEAGPLELLSISCVGIDGSVPDSQIRDFLSVCQEIDE